MKSGVVACDLGASSGRIMFVYIENNSLVLDEIHRFLNEPIKNNKGLFWDISYIFSQIKLGVKKILTKGDKILSLGIDTWGVDYGWIDSAGKLVQNPYCYRDSRVDTIIEDVHKIINLQKLYQESGNSFYKFNSIYQIFADLKFDEKIINEGNNILFLPNLIGYLFTGKQVSEYSIASTSGLLNQEKREWSDFILEKLNFKQKIFPKLVEAGSVLGEIKSELKNEFNGASFPIININSHDSASAVNYANNFTTDTAFLINGTWSLIGILKDNLINNADAFKLKITNEGQENKKTRINRLMPGTWILQRLKLDFENLNKNYSFSDFSLLAQKSSETGNVDLDFQEFIYPDSMIDTMKLFLPQKEYNDGDLIKIAYNSILKKYKESFHLIEKLNSTKINTIYALGGGVQDKYLIEQVKKELNINIKLGPIEASVIGNAKTQFFALNLVSKDDEWNKYIVNYLANSEEKHG